MNKEKESKLITILKEDKQLEGDTKSLYIGLANNILEDFKNNLSKTSIELNEESPVGVDTWRDFLNYAPVRSYLQTFRDEEMRATVEGGLMKGNKDLVGIKKVMDSEGPAVNNSNIIVFRLPEKNDLTNIGEV